MLDTEASHTPHGRQDNYLNVTVESFSVLGQEYDNDEDEDDEYDQGDDPEVRVLVPPFI